MSKYTIQETESINSKTGAREKIYVAGIEGEKTDANGFYEFKTREEAEAKAREIENGKSISWAITVPCSDTTFFGGFLFPYFAWGKLTEEERSQKILEDIGGFFIYGDGKDYLEIY